MKGWPCPADPWGQHVQAQMKKIVYYSLQSVQDDVSNRSKSFTLFGYDFMLDETLNVWLLEVLTLDQSLNRALGEP